MSRLLDALGAIGILAAILMLLLYFVGRGE